MWLRHAEAMVEALCRLRIRFVAEESARIRRAKRRRNKSQDKSFGERHASSDFREGDGQCDPTDGGR